MHTRAALVAVLSVACLVARSDTALLAEPAVVQAIQGQAAIPDPAAGVVYICPMDPDVRSYNGGVCRRCGMNLVAGLPDPVEFHLDTRVMPASPVPARPAVLQFFVHDPWKNRPV